MASVRVKLRTGLTTAIIVYLVFLSFINIENKKYDRV